MRIWYQSFTDPDETRGYHEVLVGHASRAARRGTKVEVSGMRPASRRHRITELRCGLEVVRNAIRAEREGCDAFIVGHFQDSGLWEARSAVRIPVIGLGESSMLHACTLGRSIGLITIHPIFIPFHHDQVRRYGLEHRVTTVRAVNSASGDYVRAFADRKTAKKLAAHYLREIELLVAQGIEVVLPAGGLPSLLFAGAARASAAPAILLDSIAIAVKAAEMATELRRFNGTEASRASTFALPSEAAFEAVGMPEARPRRTKRG